MADADTLIRLDEVGVYFSKRTGLIRRQRRWALRGINLTVKRGETLGVVGGNGSGKSTLLRLLADVIECDEGRVLRRPGLNCNLLTLQLGFLPHLSGRRNAFLSGILMGLSRAEIAAKIPDIIEFSELGDTIDEPLYSYSSGMRMRLGFSVANLVRPDVLLLDEVMGVGDAGFRKKSSAALRERVRSDSTVVVVSHNLGFIKSVCDRVGVLKNGTMPIIGPSEAVCREYEQGL